MHVINIQECSVSQDGNVREDVAVNNSISQLKQRKSLVIAFGKTIVNILGPPSKYNVFNRIFYVSERRHRLKHWKSLVVFNMKPPTKIERKNNSVSS